MEGGRILHPLPSLDDIRLRFQDEFARLPHRYKALRRAPQYPVRLSPGLSALQSRLERQFAAVPPSR
ncbi:MAG: hypothetical protein HY680_08560 [Chloroflexi bacterium]|nr:hypothetical protein [Chloroflexota bacterium]